MSVMSSPPVPSGRILWFTGLSGSGKTTLCTAVAVCLRADGHNPVLLDGDDLRKTVCKDLGFSREDREENMRRIGALASSHGLNGATVLVAAIAPYRQLRQHLKRSSTVPFLEVFVDAPLSVCEERDPKGLYRRVRAGLIPSFTGIGDVYEAPEHPDIHCRTAEESIPESCAKVLEKISCI